ncbi:hypothetical protein ACJJTC_003918 [Scirpophaga incertulas]
MKLLVVLAFLQIHKYVVSEIRTGVLINKLLKIKPVGSNAVKTFLPLTEIPTPDFPHVHEHSGRRHFEKCDQKPKPKEVMSGGRVDIFGDYYDDGVAKTVATVIIPDHIDRE